MSYHQEEQDEAIFDVGDFDPTYDVSIYIPNENVKSLKNMLDEYIIIVKM